MQTVLEVFDRMQREYRPEMLAGIEGVIQFDIHGPGGGVWNAAIRGGGLKVSRGPAPKPDLSLQASTQDWLDLVSGKRSGQVLFMTGRLKVKGDIALAMKLQKLFQGL